jgi:hypothetical protein
MIVNVRIITLRRLTGYVLGLAIQIYKSHYMYKHQRTGTEFLKYLPITRSSSRK